MESRSKLAESSQKTEVTAQAMMITNIRENLITTDINGLIPITIKTEDTTTEKIINGEDMKQDTATSITTITTSSIQTYKFKLRMQYHIVTNIVIISALG